MLIFKDVNNTVDVALGVEFYNTVLVSTQMSIEKQKISLYNYDMFYRSVP
jgi:hypothetical protein